MTPSPRLALCRYSTPLNHLHIRLLIHSQQWLLGYDFPSTLILLTLDCLYIVTTTKKATFLEVLKGGKFPVEVLVRGKDADENAKQFERCAEIIKAAGPKVGVFAKEKSTTPFITEWNTAFEQVSKDVKEVDIAPAVSSAMLVKDETELRSVRDASRLSSALMRDYFIDYMSGLIDSDKKVTHKAMSDKLTGLLDRPDTFKEKVKMFGKLQQEYVDWSIQPIVQSGSNFDLKMSAMPNEQNLHPGVIMATFGFKYNEYCSLVARTYLVDPNKSQEKTYQLLLDVHNMVVQNLKDGAVVKDVHDKALDKVRSSQPDLEKHFVKSLGYAVGLEPKDSLFVIDAKNTATLRDGMTLTVCSGLRDITNPKSQNDKDKTYSLLISDTVRVGDSEGMVFTKDAPTDLESTTFFFNDDEDEQKEEKKPAKQKKDARIGAVAQTNIRTSRLREGRAVNQKDETDAARKEHQKELHAKKQQEGVETYGAGTGNLNGEEKKKFKRFESYKQPNQLPSKVKDMAIIVDPRNSSILLPIMGRPVPFHINTIKTAVHAAESGGMETLRINFLSPGQGVGRKEEPFEDPTAHFIRSMTFRSTDTDRMANIAQQITDMKKEAVRKLQERKEMEDVVEQDRLIEVKSEWACTFVRSSRLTRYRSTTTAA